MKITVSSSPIMDGVSSKEILISGVNWISGKVPDVNKNIRGGFVIVNRFKLV